MSSDKKTVLIIGLGFSGLRVYNELKNTFNVKIVEPKDFFDFVPKGVDSMFSAKDAASSLVPLSANAALAAAIIPGLVTAIASIDDGTKGYGTLADGQRIDFDYAIIATGSAYGAWKAPATSGSTKAARQATLGSCYAAMEVADDIIVVGGGPVGVEAAAAAAETFPGKKVTVVVGGERLMDKFEQQVSDIAAKWLKEHGVTLLYGERVQDWGGVGATPSTGTITTDKGTTLSGLILSCIGGKPNTAEFAASLPAGSIAPNGAVNVESTLQVVGLRNVFAAGDVAATPEEKTANYADYAGLCVARNIAALDAGKELVTFPGGLFGGATKLPMLAGASLGSKNGVMQMGTDVQAGPATAYLRAFFVKMYCRTIAGSWVWGLVFRGVKGMFAGQIKTLALKASKEGAGAA